MSKGISMDLPIDFINKMKKLLGSDAENFFAELDNPAVKGITINTSRINKADFEKICDFNISPIEHIDNGYYVDNIKFATIIFNHL